MTPVEWVCARCGHLHDDDRACQSVLLGHGQTCNCSYRRSNPTHTPPRSIRVEEALWQAAVTRAAERGESVSEAVRKFLTRYTKERK